MHVKNLSLYHKEDERFIVENLSFSLGQGDKLALIGEEGNGKSLLLRALAEPEKLPALEITGEIQLEGRVIAYLPQEIPEATYNLSTLAYLEQEIDPLYFDYGLYYDLLDRMGIPESFISHERFIHTLSGGEKIKFLLLVECLRRPDLYLLDEPSNDFDISSLLWLEDFIMSLHAPLLYVSHDEVLLENTANAILLIEQLGAEPTTPQTTFSRLNYKDFKEKQADLYVRGMQVAKKDEAILDDKMERYRRVRDSVEHQLRTVSRGDPGAAKNLKDKMHSVKSMGRRFEKEHENMRKRPQRERAIRLEFEEDLNIPHSGKEVLDISISEIAIEERVLARDVELHLRGVQKIAIVGANGSGKSTLLRILLGEFAAGDVPYAYMPQNYYEGMDPKQTAIEFLLQKTGRDKTTVHTYLGSIEFSQDEMNRPLGTLSGGQRGKLYLAQIVLSRASYLLLDEPSRNLSPLSGPTLRAALRAYRGGIIAVSHDRKFIREVCDRVYRLGEEGLHELNAADLAEYLERGD